MLHKLIVGADSCIKCASVGWKRTLIHGLLPKLLENFLCTRVIALKMTVISTEVTSILSGLVVKAARHRPSF